tara:strand:- start:42 stop:482 length:441 start_codon:yes stop_codon:yes gene_type:complete
MRTATLFMMMALSACQAAPVEDAQESPQTFQTTDDEATKPIESPSKPVSESVASQLGSYDPEDVQPEDDLCWQDYCPCENPETALDHTICRNARGGIEMSDEQWSFGAMSRDIKRSGDEANRQMDEVLSDAAAQRAELRESRTSDY